MELQEKLTIIAAQCLNQQNPDEIAKSYADLLAGIVDRSNLSDQNLHLETGMALGSIWAADCVNDAKRTVSYLRAILCAIKDRKKEKPLHLLYVGTGPFATLILPALCYFDSSVFNVTLLEVNETSIVQLKRVIDKLELDSRVKGYINCNAVDLKVTGAYDIVISETMQSALEREQQTSIFWNLYDQLPESTLFIPEKIVLKVAGYHSDQPKNLISVANFFELSHRSNRHHLEKLKIEDQWFKVFEYLTIQTTIHLYKKNQLKPFESGLTYPKILLGLTPELKGKQMQFSFEQDRNPQIVYKIASL